MSFLNEKPAVQHSHTPLWKRAAVILGSSSLCALFALVFYPPAFEAARSLIAQPISSAIASDNGRFVSPAQARRQQLGEASIAVHGMYVKDPYGCVYMFQYVSAQLSLTPVLDEQRQPVCK